MRNIGQRSLAAKAREAILESIMDQRFEDGRIPPEHDLADMLGVSRTTVRAALQSLQEVGVIVRTRGRGTTVRRHVRPSMLALQRLVGFTTMLRETGLTPSAETASERLDEPPPEIATRLQIGLDEPWYRLDKLLRADGAAAILITSYCPVSYLTGDVHAEAQHLDWFQFGERFGREPVDHAIVEITPAAADAETASRLEMAEGTPLIVLLETHYGESEEPLGYSRIAVNPAHVTFEVLRSE